MWSIDMLVHLRAFVAVAEVESFSGAADELAIGQPLLSRRIKSLEVEVGAELFDRSRRQIVITDVGRALLEPARALIARADLFEDTVRATLGSDRIRLGVPFECDPRAIARIVTKAAESSQLIEVLEFPSVARDAALADGALDAALLRCPADAASFRVELGLASGRRIASARGGVVHLDDIRRRRGEHGPVRNVLLSAEDDVPSFVNGFQRAAVTAGLAIAQIETVTSASQALMRVLAADDVLLCSAKFAERHDLEWLPLADRSLSRTYRLALTRSFEKNVRWRGVLESLSSVLGAALDAANARPDGARTASTMHPLMEAWN